MLAIDTDVLVRLPSRNDTRQAFAADQAITKGASVSHLVLAEATRFLGAVSARSPKQMIAALGFSACLVLEIARKAGQLRSPHLPRHLPGCPGHRRCSQVTRWCDREWARSLAASDTQVLAPEVDPST